MRASSTMHSMHKFKTEPEKYCSSVAFSVSLSLAAILLSVIWLEP